MSENVEKTFMEQMEEMLPDVLIHSVAFDHRDDVVEVTFAELRDQADGVGLIKTIAMERELFKVEIGEVESDLRDLISEAEQAIRNKDALKARADRLHPREEEEEDDD